MSFLYPTGKGVALLALGGGIYVASTLSHSGLMFLILGILAACFVFNVVGCWRSTRQLKVAAPPSATAVEGEKIQGAWQLDNRGGIPIGLVEISGDFGVALRMQLLGPHERIYQTPDLRLSRRGIYTYDSLRVVSGYPFDLVRSRRRLQEFGRYASSPSAEPATRRWTLRNCSSNS